MNDKTCFHKKHCGVTIWSTFYVNGLICHVFEHLSYIWHNTSNRFGFQLSLASIHNLIWKLFSLATSRSWLFLRTKIDEIKFYVFESKTIPIGAHWTVCCLLNNGDNMRTMKHIWYVFFVSFLFYRLFAVRKASIWMLF